MEELRERHATISCGQPQMTDVEGQKRNMKKCEVFLGRLAVRSVL
jgi:hypothetical protein